jgi:2-dehydro-3-deoxyphosphogluconate aldolase/(4S)-4-hydroxy-2-oxoglutarate aldolase
MSGQLRTIAILRGFDPGRTRDIAELAWSAGVDLVEVPVQDPSGWDALEHIAALPNRGRLGVGTVLRPEQVARAASVGCSVIISPGLDPDVVEVSLDAGVLPLPGVFTPTEVSLAVRLGLDTVKVFPAGTAGPSHISALLGPFPRMRLIAVGGVDAENAPAYAEVGAAGVAFGSSVERILAAPDPKAVIDALHELF